MTETPEEALPLDAAWNEPVRNIPEGGLERSRGLSPRGDGGLIRELDLLAIPAFEAHYRIRPRPGPLSLSRGACGRSLSRPAW